MDISLHIQYSSENAAYIDTMSGTLGMSKKNFVNAVFDAHRKANIEQYQEAQKRQAQAKDVIDNVGEGF